MFGEEIMGVQRHTSLLPIRVGFNYEWVIEQESERRSTAVVATPNRKDKDREEREDVRAANQGGHICMSFSRCTASRIKVKTILDGQASRVSQV